MGKLYIRSKDNTGRYKTLGFYTVLAFSLMAVGAAAWSTTVRLEPEGNDPLADGSQTQSVAEVDKVVSDQLAEMPEEEAQQPEASTDSQTEAIEMPDKTVATYFVLPVSGEILKKFDEENLQYSETYGDLRLHTGIDIAAEADSRIKSAGNGVVKQVYTDENTGNTVVIDHGNGILAYYCGLNNVPMVQEGDTVVAGSDLGSLATVPEECADAPHLHFAIQKDGKWISPLSLMNMET